MGKVKREGMPKIWVPAYRLIKGKRMSAMTNALVMELSTFVATPNLLMSRAARRSSRSSSVSCPARSSASVKPL